MRTDYLEGEKIDTIYFGGGTPSILEISELEQILEKIQKTHLVSPNVEITLEANPDDLSEEKLRGIKSLGINRLSVGIQSFDDGFLKKLNRLHNGKEAIEVVNRARKVGFDNLSLDLIYAIPSNNHDIWMRDLETMMRLKPEHISAYALTVEHDTAFGNWLRKGKFTEVEEDFAAEQFEMLLETLNKNGYEQYEISNFSLPDKHSRHNSGYWRHAKYLGLGPGAHSYNGKQREYNVPNNPKYAKAIESGELPAIFEPLNLDDQINEYILTSLRTKWGTDAERISNLFEVDLLSKHREKIENLTNGNYIYIEKKSIFLTEKGKLLADKIATDLFV
ncbi:coproporphyrinogen III oxidase [Fulvitalea axinellae]|uniref:Heme chaperone HemW n=2 Tax=Fulvitalea axinellae TaxID=1182444 RepID=A0AAU9CM20_9BACT|nr:coproporphyrinogen III oxidase [Fulvitalea axinellae]